MTGEMLIFRPVGMVFLDGGMIEDPEDVNDFRNMVWTKETLYSDLKMGSLPVGMILKVKGYEPYVVVRNENKRQSQQKLVFLSTALSSTQAPSYEEKMRRMDKNTNDRLYKNEFVNAEVGTPHLPSPLAGERDKGQRAAPSAKPRATVRRILKATRVG